jgi:hypothetical protein
MEKYFSTNPGRYSVIEIIYYYSIADEIFLK